MRTRNRNAFLATAGSAMATVAIVRGPARAARFSWKCGDSPAAEHPLNIRLNEAFFKIRQETNGDLDIRNYPGGALGSDPSMISQLRLGALEMMSDTGDVFDALVPIASIDNVPFAFPNYQTAWKAYDNDLGPMVRKEFLAKGLVAFERVYDVGFREITTSTRPIRTVDDLNGVKLRVPPSKFRVDLFRSLGASPTPVNFVELYSALQTHVVDGYEGPVAFIEVQKFYEVQKYCSMSNHMWGAFWVLVNQDKWNSLPRNFQEIARKHLNAGALLQRRDIATMDASLRDKLTRRGMVFNEVDIPSFRAKLRTNGFYGRWKDTWGATAWNALEKYSGPLG